jgi:hypothetical protein
MYLDGDEVCNVYDDTSSPSYLTKATTYTTSGDGGASTDVCGYYLKLQYTSGFSDGGEWYLYLNKASTLMSNCLILCIALLMIY